MKETTQQCIANCLRTLKDSHVMYRSYGLNPVDEIGIPMRKEILIQLSTYYPAVDLENITVTKASIDGQFNYDVEIKGL